MTTTVRKGLIGKQDIQFWSSASPTFTRTTSTGGSTTPLTSFSATIIPFANATGYWTVNNVQRAVTEGISRFFSVDHSIATLAAGARVGHHKQVMGFKNALYGTSIQAVASNMYLANGFAQVILPGGTYTVATPIQLPKKCVLIGNGRHTVVRASSTIQTSRVFSVSGSAGATSQQTSAVATVAAKILSITNGAQYTAGGWVQVQTGIKNELHQVKSVAANDLNLEGKLRYRYPSNSTVKVIYPAEIYLDNLEIQLTSATQGIGVAATYMVQSVLGENLVIRGAANAGVKTVRSDQNRFKMVVKNPKSVASGKGYGVWLTTGSQDNEVGGIRQGVTKDVADGSSVRNVERSTHWIGSYEASGIVDPVAFWYRMRKPELSHVTYGSTIGVSCYASSTSPAEVFIDGQVFRNTGTTICDLSRTIAPASATIGGMDRGPATATRAYYIYGVPTQNPSATRQWDLVASSQSQATGPLASATFPLWSWLGAVVTGASVRILPFKQMGDEFITNRTYTMAGAAAPMSSQATFRVIPFKGTPVGTKAMRVFLEANNGAGVTSVTTPTLYVASADETNSNNRYFEMSCVGFTGTGQSFKPINQRIDWCGVDSNRRIAWRNSSAASVNYAVGFMGYRLDRAAYK